jgi:TetR/AcrR family transcriptional repressor of nem operon
MARPKVAAALDTATRILDVAERLVQRRGFNAVSYADIAAQLKITTASIHYHFAGKGELGKALVERYAARFFDALEAIDATMSDANAKLQAYAGLYTAVLRDKRLCLCGMLAAEYQTLPKSMRDAVIRFFDENEAWLTRVVTEGQEQGALQFSGSPQDAARMIVGGLEGAMLVARPYGDVARFQSAAEQLLAGLAARAPVTAS